MEEEILKDMIEKLKLDNSIQTEQIKDGLKLLVDTAYKRGYSQAERDFEIKKYLIEDNNPSKVRKSSKKNRTK